MAKLEELRIRSSNSIQVQHRRIDCNKTGEFFVVVVVVVVAVSVGRVDVFIHLRFFSRNFR